jgi:hypothetical protein
MRHTLLTTTIFSGLCLSLPSFVYGQDATQADVAKSLLQFGISTGSLIWTSIDTPTSKSKGDAAIGSGGIRP